MQDSIGTENKSLREEIEDLKHVVSTKIGPEGGNVYGKLFVPRGENGEEAVNVSQLQEISGDYVEKSGDTMTGALGFSGGYILNRPEDMVIAGLDYNNGYVSVGNNGSTTINAKNDINLIAGGEAIYKGYEIATSNDLNGKVNKSGDVMTGSLAFAGGYIVNKPDEIGISAIDYTNGYISIGNSGSMGISAKNNISLVAGGVTTVTGVFSVDSDTYLGGLLSLNNYSNVSTQGAMSATVTNNNLNLAMYNSSLGTELNISVAKIGGKRVSELSVFGNSTQRWTISTYANGVTYTNGTSSAWAFAINTIGVGGISVNVNGAQFVGLTENNTGSTRQNSFVVIPAGASFSYSLRGSATVAYQFILK